MVRIILKSVDILRRSTTTREEFGEIDDEIFEKKKVRMKISLSFWNSSPINPSSARIVHRNTREKDSNVVDAGEEQDRINVEERYTYIDPERRGE